MKGAGGALLDQSWRCGISQCAAKAKREVIMWV